MQLKHLKQKFNLSERALRYVLERGIVPGLVEKPGTGNRRKLTEHQALVLVTVTLCHSQGLRGPLLRRIARELIKPDWHGVTVATMHLTTIGLKLELDLGYLRGLLRASEARVAGGNGKTAG